MKPKKTTLGVKVDSETRERLRELGEIKDRSTHWMVREAIARYLADEEVFERERAEDEARWRRYAETGRFVRHEDVLGRLKHFAQLAEKRVAEAE